MRMQRALAVAVMLGLAALAAAPALAGTDDESFLIQVDVVPSCKITAATPMVFPALDVEKALIADYKETAQGTITVLCTAGPTYSVDLDLGDNENVGQRRMAGAGAHASGFFLAYNLFKDAGAANAWGAGVDGQSFDGDGTRQNLTVYGQLPWSEALLPSTPVGAYQDTVTATVNF